MNQIKCMNCGVELYAVNMGNRFDWICPQCNGGIVNGPNPVDNTAENVDKSTDWKSAFIEEREKHQKTRESKASRDAEIRMLRQDNKSLRKDRDEYIGRSDRLARNLDECQKDRDRVARENAVLDSKVIKLMDEREKLQASYTDVVKHRSDLDAMEKKYREARDQLAKFQGMRADIFVRLQTLDDRDVYIVAKTISSVIPSNNGGVKIHTTGTDHIVKNDLQDVIRLIELTIGGEEDEEY